MTKEGSIDHSVLVAVVEDELPSLIGTEDGMARIPIIGFRKVNARWGLGIETSFGVEDGVDCCCCY